MSVLLRGAGFQPNQLNGLVGWWRADQGVTLDTSNNVQSWADLSGNGNTLSQATAGQRPTLVRSDRAFVGQPSISFNSATSGSLTNSTLNVAQPDTIYVVGYVSAFSPSVNLTIFDSPGTRQTLFAALNAGQQTALGTFAGSIKNSTNSVLTMGVPFCVACTFNGASSNAWLGNSVVPVVGLSAFNLGTNNLVQMQLYSFSTNFTSGALAEMLIFSGAHTQQQVSWVFQYLASRYNPGAWQ